VARIGLQLYTLRDDAASDLAGTLARVGRLGFEGVELFPLAGVEAAGLRRLLDANGLAVAGRHASLADIEDGLDTLAAELATLGTDRLTLAWIDPPESAADADVLVDRLVECARRVREHGLVFGFHNHWGELRPLDDGRTFLDRLLEVPGDLVSLELDLGWVWDAGADPEELLARAAGRCRLVHVKDFSTRGERAFAPVGEGAVGYERVVPAAVRAGAEWLLVEQDEIDGPPFDAVERSLAAVRRFLA
jgi:sugar phosphate isomerase/epimerase